MTYSVDKIVRGLTKELSDGSNALNFDDVGDYLEGHGVGSDQILEFHVDAFGPNVHPGGILVRELWFDKGLPSWRVILVIVGHRIHGPTPLCPNNPTLLSRYKKILGDLC